MDGNNESSSESKDEVLRIVIDRSASTRPKTAQHLVLPTLEIPIPHYRLGKPHFNAEGTPLLRSSAYTRTSEELSSENPKSIARTKNDLPSPAPTETEDVEMSKNHPSQGGLDQSDASSEASRGPEGVSRSSTRYRYRDPINPKLFDKLATVKDEASVVRYSQKTGAITAATPARIVAQISSEAFMDYELVSDFFLTFRAYLSTESLLSLLLARLRWAINRLEDDGRIIRIRTFAALRHWILNYFADDFVVNRNLRVQFCDRINDIYNEVKKRTGGGVSDLKILLDLKRCWNGRCSLYWDSQDFVIDNHQEADIIPGGVLGSRDPSLTQLHEVTDQESIPTPETYQEKISSVRTWFGRPPTAQGVKSQNKEASFLSAGAPVSPTSERSLQPASCSLPARALKRSPLPEGHTRGPYPKSLQLRKQDLAILPPSAVKDSQRRLSQIHKRSASTSDSIRDRKSLTSLSQPVFVANPHAGSLIRGNVYPPAPPFVDVIAPESPPSQRSRPGASATGMSASFESFAKPGLLVNPGMRTFMGSIRRALSSKQNGSTSGSSTEETTRSAPSIRGKTSGLPQNMAKSTDNLKDKKSASNPRHHLRIDLLCAAVSESYQTAQAKASQDSVANHGLGVCISDIHEVSGSQHSIGSRDFSVEIGDVRAILGQDVARYNSTVSDDDAALDLQLTKMRPEDLQEIPLAELDLMTVAMISMPILSTEDGSNRRQSSWINHRRSSSVDTALTDRTKGQGKPRHHESIGLSKDARVSTRKSSPSGRSCEQRSVDTTSNTPRNHQYSQSKASRHGPQPSVDASVTSRSTNELLLDAKPQSAAHTLRRRPGGNLRNTENTHDLVPVLRRQSTGSLTTQTESIGSMLVIGGNRPIGTKAKTQVSRHPQHPVSLIRTHSSQHLRPSFEAAISGFSSIPDSDDGGLEATLLKLEGRYENTLAEMANATSGNDAREQTTPKGQSFDIQSEAKANGQDPHSKSGILPVSSHRSNPSLRQPAAFSKTKIPSTKSASTGSGRSKSSTANSEDSYSSIPLLERGLADDALKKPRAFPKSSQVPGIPPPVFEKQADHGLEQDSTSSHSSIELLEKTERMGRIRQGSTLPGARPTTAAASVLLEDDDEWAEPSSELSVDVIEHTDVTPRVAHSVVAGSATQVSGHEIPTHPLAHPPSPAFSFHHAVTSVPPKNPMAYQQKPLTPQPSPTPGDEPRGSQVPSSRILPPRKSGAIASATMTTNAGHIPFVLACESEVLAQQFTLVEKAALSEIDWSDLVDMKWDNKSPNILNWVEYLAAKENRGIDIVITRFNIVVKWVLSEIVMTQNLHERARAIIKYIHIAAHTRQIHNYATMLQITIALTSIDCSRLKVTWELVPDLEKALLKEMEELIQPVRNFHDLRIEMETANLQDGCIPFFGTYPSNLLLLNTRRASLTIHDFLSGLYIHDLTYNAQKPSQIATTSDGGGEPLVNFEKHRTTATIVKSLLRLIDASTKYDYAPIAGIIERCLWIAALSDAKITGLSRSAES